MAMEKRAISKNSVKALIDSHTFAKGTRFSWDERIWIVTEERTDGGAEMRRLASSKGDDEIYMLSTLRKYLTSAGENFSMMKPFEPLQEGDENNETDRNNDTD